MRGDCRRRDAVLTRAGLGDDVLFAHTAREQDLAERVIDFVRAGVKQVLALQKNLRAPEVLSEPLGEIQRGRAAGEIAQQIVELALESQIGFGAFVFGGKIVEGRHESLRHEHSAVGTEMAARIRELWSDVSHKGKRPTSNAQRPTSN